MKIICTSVIIIFFCFSCSDAAKAKFSGYGSEFKVEMISCDGNIIRTWISTGKVSSEQDSDGYYFMEKGTDKLIEVTGDLIITKLENTQ